MLSIHTGYGLTAKKDKGIEYGDWVAGIGLLSFRTGGELCYHRIESLLTKLRVRFKAKKLFPCLHGNISNVWCGGPSSGKSLYLFVFVPNTGSLLQQPEQRHLCLLTCLKRTSQAFLFRQKAPLLRHYSIHRRTFRTRNQACLGAGSFATKVCIS